MRKYVLLLEKILTILLVLFICILIVRVTYLYSTRCVYESDDAWNATVSKNFAFKGVYKASRAGIFHPVISTGTPVLLLEALIFKIFGINHFTSFFIIVIYSLVLFVFSILLIGRKNKLYLLGVIIFTSLLFSNRYFGYTVTKLYGEIPAVCLSFIALYILFPIFEKKEKYVNDEKAKLKICFIAGIFFGLALLTKIIMAFLIISFMGLLIIDIIVYKNFTIKDYFSIIGGILFILFLEYIFRLVQFNFSFKNSINSVVKYVKDMYMQSRWGEWRKVDTSNIYDRIGNLPILCNWTLIPIVYVTLPAFIYIPYVLFKKKENLLMVYFGVCVSSIFIYYILFGTIALHAKRMFPYSYMLLCYYVYFILVIIKKICDLKKIDLIKKTLLLIYSIIFIFLFLNTNYKGSYKDFYNLWTNPPYIANERAREDEYIRILQNIPLDSIIITIVDNASVMCLYTDFVENEQIYTIRNARKAVDEFLQVEKAYFVCDSLDYQSDDPNKYFDILDSIGIDVYRLNKIQTNVKHDIYGVYELHLRDRDALVKWKKNKF